ncbi:MAG: cytochrome c oxidase subunit 3 [Verrucomicrobiae bacterium]|nr:cytochrome c oxidase subunit 3 [Verrucomicrobiae bacterium]
MSAEIAIPYNDTERPDTGLYNAKLGVWLFLASEVMLFGALFSSYILLRVASDRWEHGADILNVPLATLNTVVLIASSVTMVLSWAALKAHNFARYRRCMGLTFLAGGIFLIVKYIEYSGKARPWTGTGHEHIHGDLLHHARPACAACHRRYDRQRLPARSRCQDVAN